MSRKRQKENSNPSHQFSINKFAIFTLTMHKTITYIFILGLFFSFKSTKNDFTSQNGNLKIVLSNIRNTKGYIYIFVYQYKNQYPYNPYKHYKVNKSKVKNGKLTALISNLKFCDNCAITLIDDENNNQDLDRWLGIPHEGYGFSNNVRPLLSLPKYSDLIFDFKTPKKINVKLQYVL